MKSLLVVIFVSSVFGQAPVKDKAWGYISEALQGQKSGYPRAGGPSHGIDRRA